MNGSDFGELFGGLLGSTLCCIVPIVILIVLIVIAVNLVQKSKVETQKTEQMYRELAMRLPSDKQGIFLMQYQNVSKNSTTAVLLALFLGGVGGHKFYMGDVGLGVIYLIFSWTSIPYIIAVIESFGLPIKVNKFNQEKMFEISTMLGGG